MPVSEERGYDVIVYGVCIGTEAKYDAFAKPGLSKYAPGAPVLERRGQSSIFEAYNSILDETRSMDGVEGLVLIHEDVELRGSVEETLRAEFSDPEVAIVGAIGGRGVRSVRWSRSEETFGYAPDAFYGQNDHGRGRHDVDLVDGLFLGLSPWAIENLRFDADRFSGFHAYDADISMQARAAGHRVRVAELDLFHHTKGGFGDAAHHRLSDDLFRRKWQIPLDPRLYRLMRQMRGQAY